MMTLRNLWLKRAAGPAARAAGRDASAVRPVAKAASADDTMRPVAGDVAGPVSSSGDARKPLADDAADGPVVASSDGASPVIDDGVEEPVARGGGAWKPVTGIDRQHVTRPSVSHPGPTAGAKRLGTLAGGRVL